MRAGRSATVLSVVATVAVVASLGACRRADRPARETASPEHPAVVVFFGDSLIHGLGLHDDDALPAVLQRRLNAEGLHCRCVNAGVPGDTTADGLDRIDDVLAFDPSIVVVELGANDALRGIDRRRTRGNLAGIVERLRAAGAGVVLAGTAFPQMHPAQARAMARLYEDVARSTGVALVADLMDGVAGRRDLNLADGIHPNRRGHLVMADNLWPTLVDEVYRLDAGR